MLKRIFGIGVVIAPSILLTGCLAGKSMPQEHYLLQAKVSQKLCANKAMNSINVMPFSSVPPFTSEQFIYRLSDSQWQADYYHTFMSPINQQFVKLTSNALQASHCWTDVGNVWQPLIDSSYTLNASIQGIYADYRNRQHPTAALIVDYKLRNTQTNQIIWKHLYQKNIPLADKSTEALVAAWEQAATQITQQLSFDLKKISWQTPVVKPASQSVSTNKKSQLQTSTLKSNLLKQLQASPS